MNKEAAKKVFEKVVNQIDKENLLFLPEKTKVQFDTWTAKEGHTFSISVITESQSPISVSQAWGAHEDGQLFNIDTDNADQIIQRMKSEVAIR